IHGCSFLWFGFRGLRFIAIKKVGCDALALSRGPEGDEFRAAEAGSKNGVRASARRELQDIAARNFGHTGLAYKEIARSVKGQAPVWLWLIARRSTRNGAEDDPFSIWCELEDSAGLCGTSVI